MSEATQREPKYVEDLKDYGWRPLKVGRQPDERLVAPRQAPLVGIDRPTTSTTQNPSPRFLRSQSCRSSLALWFAHRDRAR